MLQVHQLNKTYKSGDNELNVLKDITFHVKAGESLAIMGPSGSGKTTLLGLCAGLDQATSGDIMIDGQSLTSMSEDERAALRKQYVGFIFQNFQLLPTLTALENVMVPLELKKSPDAKNKALSLLDKVGLSGRTHHFPSQLSGGEQQRVAIARAFANAPKILFADEPTGNLDADTGDNIEDLIFQMNKDQNTTLILVTHDPNLAKRTERTLHIKGGQITEANHG